MTQSSAKLRESQSSPGQRGPEPEASVDTGQSDGIHTAFPLPTLLAWRWFQGKITRPERSEDFSSETWRCMGSEELPLYH